jgi:predicted DNA binding protein
VPNPLVKVFKEGNVVVRSDFTILLSKEGKESFVSGRATPIIDKDRGIIGAVISFRDISEQKILEDKIFDAEQYDLLGEIASARILVDFPEQFWLSEASRSYPHVNFEILSILPTSLVGDPTTFIDTELVKINSVEWSQILEIIENHPSIIELHRWDVQESEILINVKAKDAFILRSLIQSECILNYPIVVKNGQSTWELISVRRKIDAMLELLEQMGISYSMLSINPYRLGASQLTLTKHQEMVLEKALAMGYYEIPRRITLSELATELNMAKSSLSGILRRISRNLVKK